jgi:hypothetical protein
MADLTTLANARAWLNLTSQDDDVLLARLITAASGFIESYINRTLGVHSVSEVRDGLGGRRMVLSDYPIVSVTTLAVNGVAIPAAADVVSNGYRVVGIMVLLTGYIFSKGLGNVEVTYSSGYATTPPEIEQACIELVAWRYKERDRIGQSSKSVGAQETVTYSIKDMPDDVKTILNQYKKVFPI